MNSDQWTEPQEPGAGSASSSASDHARRSGEGFVEGAKAAASDAQSHARQVAAEKAEKLQDAAATHLRTFADAVRNAGEELAEKDPGPVSSLVRQAAEGLEQFSGALGRKSSGEMIDGVREFGRQNPLGFFAGSMLAGFALARFAGSAAPRTRNGGSDGHHTHARSSGSHVGHGSPTGEWGDRRHTAAASGSDAAGASDASLEGNRRTDA